MIRLPPDFDVSSLVSDFVMFLAPFFSVAVVFCFYRLVKRSLGRLS